MLFISPAVVNLLAFKINAIDNSSVVNVGPVQYIDQFVAYKRNQGYGEQNGDLSPTNLPFDILLDTDLVDSTAGKNSAI